MTKPKKFQYRIQYVDNTYQIVDWTRAEFETVGSYMAEREKVIIMDEGIYRLEDIRAIVFIPEPEPEPEEDLQNEDDKLSEWGFVDHDTAMWLKAQGIEPGEVKK